MEHLDRMRQASFNFRDWPDWETGAWQPAGSFLAVLWVRMAIFFRKTVPRRDSGWTTKPRDPPFD